MNDSMVDAIFITILILFGIIGIIGALINKWWLFLIGTLPFILIGIGTIVLILIDIWSKALS